MNLCLPRWHTPMVACVCKSHLRVLYFFDLAKKILVLSQIFHICMTDMVFQ